MKPSPLRTYYLERIEANLQWAREAADADRMGAVRVALTIAISQLKALSHV